MCNRFYVLYFLEALCFPKYGVDVLYSLMSTFALDLS